jgi:hypothetical protein
VLSASVDSINLPSDQVQVTVKGGSSTYQGSLLVTWNGPSGNANIASGTYAPGTYTFNPGLGSLVTGQYTGVTARWTLGGKTATGSRTSNFYALGSYRHSQYNTPYESQCAMGSGPAYVTQGPSACTWASISLRSAFVSQAWINGSGVSIGYGPLQIEWICSPPVGSDRNYFREVSSIAPGCGASYGLNSNTVAWSYQLNGNLQCGDQVLIVGLGAGMGTIKQVTDKCAPNPPNQYGCVAAQLDNYNTGAACSPKAFSDLGYFKTIRLYR